MSLITVCFEIPKRAAASSIEYCNRCWTGNGGVKIIFYFYRIHFDKNNTVRYSLCENRMPLLFGENRISRDIGRGKDLARYLNEEPPGPARTEVLKVFELCRQLDELRREAESDDIEPSSYEVAERVNARSMKMRLILRTLNPALGVFSYAPIMFEVGNHVEVFWKPGRAPGLDKPFVTAFAPPRTRGQDARIQHEAEPGVPYTPTASIIRTILDLMEAGGLSRVRQCQACGKWFFAENNKKQFCGGACRTQKIKDANPEAFRKQHADYMRKLRALKVKTQPKGRKRS